MKRQIRELKQGLIYHNSEHSGPTSAKYVNSHLILRILLQSQSLWPQRFQWNVKDVNINWAVNSVILSFVLQRFLAACIKTKPQRCRRFLAQACRAAFAEQQLRCRTRTGAWGFPSLPPLKQPFCHTRTHLPSLTLSHVFAYFQSCAVPWGNLGDLRSAQDTCIVSRQLLREADTALPWALRSSGHSHLLHQLSLCLLGYTLGTGMCFRATASCK